MAYLRSKWIPALAYLDDSWLGSIGTTHGQPARQQWLAAAKAMHIAMLLSLMREYFTLVKKCGLMLTRIQRYLGVLCDLGTATFRVSQDKLL